jgi:hypothetical protein
MDPKPGNGILADFQDDELSLFEMLDHVLAKGIVIAGEITISVANIDLVYLGVNVLAGSVDTIQKALTERPSR